ncbi:MAG TPA: alpha/beta family hydrolase [Candidatus Saccharimonadales bacterium]|nr:alpha/beta family hydrolase [Candidatus Saccharimonadales bacterium]
MTKQILFLQGGGEGAYEADQKLVDSLKQSLGQGYTVNYPAMPNEDYPDYTTWKPLIQKALTDAPDPVIVVGHSLGSSMLVKCLDDIDAKAQIAGLFLIATPFWGGNGWLYEGYQELELSVGFGEKLPKNVPVFLYQGTDDEIVSLDHLAMYAQVLPQATVREIKGADHQLHNDLSEVAKDIKSL